LRGSGRSHRWNIETDLRSLKREVRLHMLNVQSPDMAAKELVLGVAAYNLTRAVMNQAASALHLDPRQLSYALAQDTIRAFLPLFAQANREEERRQIMQEMLRVMSYAKLPRRSCPRKVWSRPCPFPKHKVAKRPTATKTPQGAA
jgi:cytochrome P450